MKKKINVDRKPISGEEIASKMNFNQLLSNFPGYVNPPFYKTGWFITSVASVAVIATVATTFLLNKEEGNDTKSIELVSSPPPSNNTEVISYDEDTPCINPPIKELDIQSDVYTLNNETGGEFTHSTRSIISIPKNTFVDKNGNALEGEIEIRYREFHDPIDFILSGIPMTYDSAGTEYTFESAGMIEIYGFQNGLPVEIAEGKSIRIEMNPKDGSSRFNLYELDTVIRNWEYKGKTELVFENVDESTGESQISVNEVKLISDEKRLTPEMEVAKKEIKFTETELNKASKDVAEHQKTEPIKPKSSVNKDRQFALDIDPKEFPELRNYSQLTFEVDKYDKNFSPDVYTIEWDDVSLSEKEKGKSYYLTLFKGSSKKTFGVFPVFEGEDLKKAMADFNLNFKTYSKELDKRKEKEAILEKKLKEQMEKFEAELAAQKKRREELDAQRAEQFALANDTYKNEIGKGVLARAFEVTRFGTWNCDSPISKPSGMKVEAAFADNNSKNLGLHNVNLIEKNRNAVFTYNSTQYHSFKFNQHEQNTIIGFTKKNELAIVRSSYFETMGKEKKHEFKMEIIDIGTMTVENVKKKLNL